MGTPVAFSFGRVQVLHLFPLVAEGSLVWFVCLILFSSLYTMLSRADMRSWGSGLTSSILGLARALPMTLDRSGRVLPHDQAKDTASLQMCGRWGLCICGLKLSL